MPTERALQEAPKTLSAARIFRESKASLCMRHRSSHERCGPSRNAEWPTGLLLGGAPLKESCKLKDIHTGGEASAPLDAATSPPRETHQQKTHTQHGSMIRSRPPDGSHEQYVGCGLGHFDRSSSPASAVEQSQCDSHPKHCGVPAHGFRPGYQAAEVHRLLRDLTPTHVEWGAPFTLVKLDMSKAYLSLEWTAIDEEFRASGIPWALRCAHWRLHVGRQFGFRTCDVSLTFMAEANQSIPQGPQESPAAYAAVLEGLITGPC